MAGTVDDSKALALPPTTGKWSHTQVGVHNVKFTWTISNYSFCLEKSGQFMESSTFSAGKTDELKWCLRLFPKGVNKEKKYFASLFLRLVSCNKGDVSTKCKFSILNSKGEETYPFEFRHEFKEKELKVCGYTMFIRRDFLLDKVANDVLTLLCEISVVNNDLSVASGYGESPNPLPSSLPSTPVKKWCRTDVKILKFSYTWTISNHSFLSNKHGESIKSLTFSSGQEDEFLWSLEMYPNGDKEENKDYVSLFLVLVSSKNKVRGKVEFCMLTAEQKEVFEKGNSKPHKFEEGKNWGYPQYLLRRIISADVVQDDRLTIVCKISIVDKKVKTSGQSTTMQFKVPECKLSSDLERLFDGSRFSDVTVVCEGHEFHCLKALLATRSKVFAAMFEHDMKEAKDNRVEVKDMKPLVMQQLLRFIYTGRAPELERRTTDLLAAADKYGLERLKVMCEEALCSSITVENVCETLVLADFHSAKHLEMEAIEFINGGQLKEVMNTAGWKKMACCSPHLVVKTILPEKLL